MRDFALRHRLSFSAVLRARLCGLLAWPCFALASEVRIESEAGALVGNGQTIVFDDTVDSITLSEPSAGLGGVRFDLEDAEGNRFSLDFAAPDGMQLEQRLYSGATRYPFAEAGVPQFAIGGNGAGCNVLSGEFEVFEVVYDASELPQSLALDAVFFCENLPERVFVQVRFDSDVDFDLGVTVDLGDDQTFAAGQNVAISPVSVASTNAGPFGFEWRQLTGIPVDIGDASSETLLFTPPVTDAAWELFTFELTVTDSVGEVGRDEIIVTVGTGLVSASEFRVRSPVTSFVGNGNRDGTIDVSAITIDQRNAGVQMQIPTDNGLLRLSLAPPRGEVLRVGQYGFATRYPFQSSAVAGLDFGVGGSCNRGVGYFDLLDIGRGLNNAIERLAVDLFYRCFEGGPDNFVSARIRIDSQVPITYLAPRSNPGEDQIRFSGQTVELNAFASISESAELSQVIWDQVSGPDVDLSDVNATSTSFVAPDVSANSPPVVLALTLVDVAGRRDTEEVSIQVLGPDDPKSFITLGLENPPGVDFLLGFSDEPTVFDTNRGNILPSITTDRMNFNFDGAGSWNFGFGSVGQLPSVLEPGVYLNARGSGDGLPLISVGGDGRGCNAGFGSFVVHEFVVDTDGQLISAAIDFEFSCDFAADLVGQLRFNSTVGLEPDANLISAGLDSNLVIGDRIELDGSGSYVGVGGSTFEWRQISGPPITIGSPDELVASIRAPSTPGSAVFELTITDSAGNTQSDTVTVSWDTTPAALAQVYVDSPPGEPLGFGEKTLVSSPVVNSVRVVDDRVTIDVTDQRATRTLIELADGLPLTPGIYRGAFGAQLQTLGRVPTRDLFDFQFALRKCNASDAWFEILEVDFDSSADPRPVLNTLAIDFWQQCAGALPLTGSIRIGSNLPLRPAIPKAHAGDDLVVRAGNSIALDGSRSFSLSEPISSYQWTQISGPALTISSPQSVSAEVSVPSDAALGEREFEITVTTQAGASATDRVTLSVVRQDEPLTAVFAEVRSANGNVLASLIEAGVNRGGVTNRFILDTETRRTVTGSDGSGDVSINFLANDLSPPYRTGFFLLEDDEPSDVPVVLVGATRFQCDFQLTEGWLNISNVSLDANGLPDRADLELKEICPDGSVVRVSARINSPENIETQAAALIGNPPTSATEGEYVDLGSVTAIFPGELSLDKQWVQLSGPNVNLSRGRAGEFYRFVAPATTADDVLRFSYRATSTNGTQLERTVEINLRDNGVRGFPDTLLTATTPGGGLASSANAFGIEAPGLVLLRSRSIEQSAFVGQPTAAPFGAIDIETETDVGGTATINLFFDAPQDAEAEWWSQSQGDEWEEPQFDYAFSSDRRSLTIAIVDGGPGDLDFRADGVVTTSGGVVTFSSATPPPPPPTTPPQTPPSGGGGGGGGSADIVSIGWLLLLLVLWRNGIAGRVSIRDD